MGPSGWIGKKTIKRVCLFVLLFFAGCCVWRGVAFADQSSEGGASVPLIQVGDPFPRTELVAPERRADRRYLGISDSPGFYLSDVKADVMFVEFMNVHCLHCQQQAPILDNVYTAVQKDPVLKDRVKFLSIGVGNSKKELKAFRREKKVPFPMVPDQDFVAMEDIGYPEGTPFLMILKKERGRFVVKFIHLGLIADPGIFLKRFRRILTGSTLITPVQKIETAHQVLRPTVTKEEILKMFIRRLESRGYELNNILKLDIVKPQPVYMVNLAKGPKKITWYAALGAEGKVCDICHDIYFIYAFNSKGTIVDLIPIHLTKFGNKEFDKKDVKRLRDIVVGKNLLQPIQFNPDTDAVSSATMTSSLIFKSIRTGRRVYRLLRKKGYIK